jgi:tetratricopeptide (TPR) repeat protein
MDAKSAVEPLRAGEIVAGVFRVEALLGQGGAGAVFRVCDERSGRRLALKQLQPPDDARTALVTSLFEREFHTLSQLAHPRIIEVYDYGLHQGSAYYTMELLDGEDLHERGKLPWREACSILSDVASSLAIIHSRGLVHRDVSARNVRCTSDGRAKLIDFGAMAPIGISHRLVGTPPFVPPEALQLQALDGRADLYGLGALAYWMLTGRYAYPAHSFHQLRDLWRTPLLTPRYYEPEHPDTLAELVLQLLQLERGERPGSAAEVMERLSGLAGLPLSELPQVGRAYLVMPNLVGRDAALSVVRGALLQSMQSGRGAALLLEGESGSGRSRTLDACVLEAKLMGAVVLRGDPADSTQGPYGLARALGSQLLQNLPDLAQQSAQPRLSLLAHLLPELAPPGERTGPVPQRRHLQAALRDWVLAVARAKHIVIAVDDVGAIDEPSAAWLAALAHGAQRRQLTLLLTAQRQATPGPVLALLHEVGRTVELPPLQAAETEALLRSLFGEAERLAGLSARIHGIAGGNPRRTMALVEQMMTRGALRYEAGSWTLPLDPSAVELPASEAEATLQRVAALGDDARTLLQALSLTDPQALTLPDYAPLIDHGDPRRTYLALDELTAAGMLAVEGDRYRVTQVDALEAARAGIDPGRTRELHARIAGVLQSHAEERVQLVLHMLLGGQERAGIELLLSLPPQLAHPRKCEIFVSAVLAAERLQLAFAVQFDLRVRLTVLAAFMSRSEIFMEHAGPLLERLERDSGLLDCFELGPELGAETRVQAAFARAQQRFESLPEAQRALPIIASVQSLLRLYSGCTVVGAMVQSLELLERPKSLEPWFGLHAWTKLTQDALHIQQALQSGRFELGYARCRAMLESIAQLPAAPGESSLLDAFRFGQLYALSLRSAIMGHASTESLVAELERRPGFRSNAWRARMVYHLALGSLDQARDCGRRAELLDLQDGVPVFLASTVRVELLVYIATDDVMGVKRTIERIEPLADAYAGWRPTLALARSHYRRLQGDLQGALEELQSATASISPGRHIDCGPVVEVRMMMLRDLGRYAEAAAYGSEMLEAFRRDETLTDVIRARRVLAEVLAQLGRLEQAKQLADDYIARSEQGETHGVWRGLGYETGARVAIAMRDEAALVRYAELCAREFGAAGNPNASAKYERLMREAAAAGMVLVTQPARPVVEPEQAAVDAARTVHSRMLTCVTPAERAERGLQLLLEATGARTGYLFGLRRGALRWLASGDRTEPSAALIGALHGFLSEQLEHETKASAALDLAPAPLQSFIDDWGRELRPLLLRGKLHGEVMIAGVAALHYDEDERPEVRKAMLDALLDALVAEDIVDPVTCVA